MDRSKDTPLLKLVVDEESARAQRELSRWLLETAPDPLPDDTDLIRSVDGCPSEACNRSLRNLIEELVAQGRLDRVQIGTRQHLTRSGGRVVGRDADKECFRLEISLDLESEKQLLYRIVIVLELIVIGLILRQWALDPDFFLSFF